MRIPTNRTMASAANQILVSSGSGSTYSTVAAGSNGTVFTGNGSSSTPVWQTVRPTGMGVRGWAAGASYIESGGTGGTEWGSGQQYVPPATIFVCFNPSITPTVRAFFCYGEWIPATPSRHGGWEVNIYPPGATSATCGLTMYTTKTGAGSTLGWTTPDTAQGRIATGWHCLGFSTSVEGTDYRTLYSKNGAGGDLGTQSTVPDPYSPPRPSVTTNLFRVWQGTPDSGLLVSEIVILSGSAMTQTELDAATANYATGHITIPSGFTEEMRFELASVTTGIERSFGTDYYISMGSSPRIFKVYGSGLIPAIR